MQAQLVAQLYATRGAIAIGSITVTVVMAGAALLAGHDLVFYALAAAMACVGVFRSYSHTLYDQAQGGRRVLDPAFFERLAMAGAWATAALIAAFSSYAVLAYPKDPVAVLAIAQSIGYLAGMSGRNTSRPLITKVQVVISGVPVTAALAATLEPAYVLIALTVLLTTVLTFSSTRILYEVFVSRHRTMEELEHLANSDTLTNLVNRRAILKLIEQRLVAREPLTLLMVDVDHFKTINDTYGHDIGDALLQSISDTVAACLASEDVAARMGGDEFMILSACGRQEAIDLARRLIARIGSQRRIKGRSIAATVSVGIVVEAYGITVEEAQKRADIALYKAKSNGRNQFALYTSELSAEHDETLSIEIDLREAIRSGQFELAYQPIYNPRSGSVTLVEALLRWNHPRRGAVSPAVFVPVAERTGLIKVLGAWALEEAVRAALTWPRNVGVSVNVSARQLESDHDYVGVVEAILRKTGLVARRLTLEITESTLFEDAPAIIETLTRLRALGVRIALDDFGTGYSSLSYLAKLPIDIIKIDKTFTDEIEFSGKANALMTAITELAHKLGLTIIVEGIETPSQLDVMRRFSLHGVQGYVYARPMSGEALSLMIKDRVPAHRATLAKNDQTPPQGGSIKKRSKVA